MLQLVAVKQLEPVNTPFTRIRRITTTLHKLFVRALTLNIHRLKVLQLPLKPVRMLYVLTPTPATLGL
jgi:hypothetical protein